MDRKAEGDACVASAALPLRHPKQQQQILFSGAPRRGVVEVVGAFEVVRFGYLGSGLSGSLAEDHVERPQPLAAALAARMRSKVWDDVERKLRCLRAVGRAAVFGSDERAGQANRSTGPTNPRGV